MDLYVGQNRQLARRRAGLRHAAGLLPTAIRAGRLFGRVRKHPGFRSGGTSTSLGQKIGQARRRKFINSYRGKPRVTRIGDPASYRQLSSTKRKRGRKISAYNRQFKLLKTVTSAVRFRWGQVQDINAAQGTYFLTQQACDANFTSMPVYILNLCSINQGNSADGSNLAAFKMWEMRVDGVTNLIKWYPVYGISAGGSGAPRYSPQVVNPTENASTSIGRKGLFDWSRVRLCIWGKKKNPTNVRVRVVRMLDDEFCPENGMDRTSGISPQFTPKVAEYWNAQLKYLLNGHMGFSGRADRKRYVKTLQEFKIDMNPIDAGAETVNSDPRPHMKHLDIFNRWNRVMDFTDRNSALPQSLTNMRDVNVPDAASAYWGGYPAQPMKNLYLIIESVQPVISATAASTATPRPAPTDTTDLSASFDVVWEANYTRIESQA